MHVFIAKMLQAETWAFVDQLEFQHERRLLFTHIPLSKPSGLCKDGPAFGFDDATQSIKWQNFLSEESSARLMERIQPAFVIHGHDHHGCYTTRTAESWNGPWTVQSGLIVDDGQRKRPNRTHPMVMRTASSIAVRELTLRASQAEYEGYLGFFELTSDGRYAYRGCGFVDHIHLWALLICTLVAIGLTCLWLLINRLKPRYRRSSKAKFGKYYKTKTT
jgi:hypothetical protein